MSKYKPLTAPITRREACLIMDRKRFDGAVRANEIVPLGKRGPDDSILTGEAPTTAPLLFSQEEVRYVATKQAADVAADASFLRMEARALGRRKPPLTRRQVANVIGTRRTGILIRSGRLVSDGALTDTQTAAHTYSPIEVSTVILSLADELRFDGKQMARMAKTRIPS